MVKTGHREASVTMLQRDCGRRTGGRKWQGTSQGVVGVKVAACRCS